MLRATMMSSAACGQPLEAEAGGDGALVHDGAVRQRLVLTVVHDREVEHLRVFAARRMSSLASTQRPSSVMATTPARLSEPMGASCWPFMPTVMQPVGKTFTTASRADGVVDELDGAGAVGDGRGVGHADDGRETAGGGGAGAGADGLLVRLAGFAEMDVDIDEAGAGDEAGGVDFLGAFSSRRRRGESTSLPSETKRSPRASRWAAGSMTRAFWIQRVGMAQRVIPWASRVRVGRRRRGRGRPCGRRCRW
jgi:hypothetical protein